MKVPFDQWLQAQPRAKVLMEDYLRGFAEAHPEWAQEGDFSRRTLTALQALETAGALRLPRDRRHYDASGEPRLPYFVTVPRQGRTPVEKPREIVWVPELAFATTLTHASRLQKLAILNTFIIENRSLIQNCIPYRERSLEIFGDEKALDRMLDQNGKIFGKLDLCAIGAMEPEAPLVVKYFDDAKGRPLLLLENHHTYWSCVQWNTLVRRYSAVAYGNGNAILGAPKGLIEAADNAQADHIAYFGDLDPKGVEIASSLSKRLAVREGPAVKPAVELYELALSSSVRRPMTADKMAYDGSPLTWLGGLSGPVEDLFSKKHWIPQESVSSQRLRQHLPPTQATTL